MPGYLSTPVQAVSAAVITPSGGLSAVNVQDAITELEAEKSTILNPTFSGTVNVPKLVTTAASSSITPITVVGSSGQVDNLLEVKNSAGSVLTQVDASGKFSAPEVYAPGTVMQIQRASSTSYQSIVSASPVALTGLSVSITPKRSNSIIMIYGMVTASWTYVSSIHVFRNGSDIVPNHGSNNQSGGATALWTHYQSSQEASRANQVFPFPVLYWDSPGTTSATTYDFRANSGWSGGTETFHLNTRSDNDMRGTSTIMVMEIAQ